MCAAYINAKDHAFLSGVKDTARLLRANRIALGIALYESIQIEITIFNNIIMVEGMQGSPYFDCKKQKSPTS